jgi:hypothetical protein
MPRTFLLIVAVMIFKEILEVSGGIGAFAQLQAETGMSALIPLCIIPFVVGLLTGVTVAFVGVAIPIFLHLVQDDLTLLFLLYVCGFAGVLLSPTHLCLVVTRDYFKADLLGVYKRLVPLVAILLAAGILIAYARRLMAPG